ncbi:MAG TPA: hypothetical protein VM364_08050 [Vicinamibacterales bacterium]|nr:hypothetical protein [Vicinamibacterales bacterium]
MAKRTRQRAADAAPAAEAYVAVRGLNYVPAGGVGEIRVEPGEVLAQLPPVRVLEQELADGTIARVEG